MLTRAVHTAEEDYMIQDPETEKKYGVNVSDALKRAKKNAGKLFAGKTFYVTPKVPVETKLLKNVVAANGGQVCITFRPRGCLCVLTVFHSCCPPRRRRSVYLMGTTITSSYPARPTFPSGGRSPRMDTGSTRRS